MQGLVLRCSRGKPVLPGGADATTGALTEWCWWILGAHSVVRAGEMARGSFPWLGLSLLRVQPLPGADGDEGVTTAAGLTEQALTQPSLYILIYFLTRLQ